MGMGLSPRARYKCSGVLMTARWFPGPFTPVGSLNPLLPLCQLVFRAGPECCDFDIVMVKRIKDSHLARISLFFPVLGTKLVSMIIQGLVFFAFGLCTMLPYIVLTLLGFDGCSGVLHWIAVVFDVSNCCFGIYVGFFSVEKKLVLGEWDEKGRVFDDDVAWDSVSHCLLTMLSLYNIFVDTVMFVYCKELHGETVSRIEEKSGGEYVKVPLDVNLKARSKRCRAAKRSALAGCIVRNEVE
ncbi:hypothetical protein ACS0TY_009946 [Phlomoides rotata]